MRQCLACEVVVPERDWRGGGKHQTAGYGLCPGPGIDVPRPYTTDELKRAKQARARLSNNGTGFFSPEGCYLGDVQSFNFHPATAGWIDVTSHGDPANIAIPAKGDGGRVEVHLVGADPHTIQNLWGQTDQDIDTGTWRITLSAQPYVRPRRETFRFRALLSDIEIGNDSHTVQSVIIRLHVLGEVSRTRDGV